MRVETTRMVPVDELRPGARNARRHSKKQIGQLAEAIKRFGFTAPIVADEKRKIIAGHGRWKAAKTLGLSEVPVLVKTGLSDPEKRALAIADNKIAANGSWDRRVLAVELKELAALLPEVQLDLQITGFEPTEVDRLNIDFCDPDRESADQSCDLAVQPISQRGDLWQCGRHRLLCGGASNRSDWVALMGRERAVAVFADPPAPHRKIKRHEPTIGAVAMRPRISQVYASLGCAAQCGRCARAIRVMLEESSRFATGLTSSSCGR